MINHVLPRMACSCAILVIVLAHCGCQSLKTPGSWASAKSKPPANPNDREVVKYWGQKDKSKAPSMDELKARLAKSQSTPATYESHLQRGNDALRGNRLDEAQKDFEKALALRPNDPDCHHRLAVVADKKELFGVADTHYEAALRQRPRDPNLLSDYGYSYFLRGEEALAESTLNKALAISPSHKGAMANLGAIFQKQGRYEDAVAMFRSGASPAEAEQYLAQLFPQRTPSGVEAYAQNQPAINPGTANSRTAPPMPSKPLAEMTTEEVKAYANQVRDEERRRRQEQMNAEMRRPQGWSNDETQQQAQQSQRQWQQQQQNEVRQPTGNAPIVLGPRSNQEPSANDLPLVTPNGGNSQGLANNGFDRGNSYGQPGGVVTAQLEEGLRAPRGANPSMDTWDGAGVRYPVGTAAGWQGQPNGNDVQNPRGSMPGQPSMNGGDPRFADSNANAQMAAQLGMNVGPGGLFPVAPAEGNGSQFNGPQGGTNSRMGFEFPSAPSYQDPNNQFQPTRGSMAPSDPRQGSSLNSPWGDSSSQPPGRGSWDTGENLGPASPASGWADFNPREVVPAGGPSTSSTAAFNDPLNRGSPSSNSNWADKPNLNAAPFNGPWPPGSQPVANGSSSSGTPNSLPMWNNGQSASRPQPTQYAPATSTQSYQPEQYPYSRTR
ncbi:MAG: tetratricopeptide repeat protein [Planctomycetes bacterium]|nr:tetratricopeptide repeat protein [Planctomycetota bacterium]